MAEQQKNKLRKMKIKEISLVDRGAGRGCQVLLAKRMTQEDIEKANPYHDEQGRFTMSGNAAYTRLSELSSNGEKQYKTKSGETITHSEMQERTGTAGVGSSKSGSARTRTGGSTASSAERQNTEAFIAGKKTLSQAVMGALRAKAASAGAIILSARPVIQLTDNGFIGQVHVKTKSGSHVVWSKQYTEGSISSRPKVYKAYKTYRRYRELGGTVGAPKANASGATFTYKKRRAETVLGNAWAAEILKTFDESKHPRGHGGKFTAGDKANVATNGVSGAFVGGALGGAVGGLAGRAVGGIGRAGKKAESAARNAFSAAYDEALKGGSSTAKAREYANSARRKIMEEAAARGGDMKEAAVSADAWAKKVYDKHSTKEAKDTSQARLKRAKQAGETAYKQTLSRQKWATAVLGRKIGGAIGSVALGSLAAYSSYKEIKADKAAKAAKRAAARQRVSKGGPGSGPREGQPHPHVGHDKAEETPRMSEVRAQIRAAANHVRPAPGEGKAAWLGRVGGRIAGEAGAVIVNYAASLGGAVDLPPEAGILAQEAGRMIGTKADAIVARMRGAIKKAETFTPDQIKALEDFVSALYDSLTSNQKPLDA